VRPYVPATDQQRSFSPSGLLASAHAEVPSAWQTPRRRQETRAKHPDVLVVERRVGEHAARLVPDNLFPTITVRNRHP
jgi:hypothetical protein